MKPPPQDSNLNCEKLKKKIKDKKELTEEEDAFYTKECIDKHPTPAFSAPLPKISKKDYHIGFYKK